MTVEEIAKSGDWKISGDVDWCDVGGCVKTADKYAEVRKQNAGVTVVDVWFFCKTHFAEYLRVCDDLRAEARTTAPAAEGAI